LETLRNARCNLVGAILNREPSRPIKSYFPRWLSCVALLLALGLGAARAQTPTTASPTPTLPAEANPQPETTDTNTTLLTEPPPTTPAPETDTHYSFSVVSPAQRAEWEKNLTLGPGDVLSFGLYGEPTLTRAEITIGPDGRISYLEAQDVLASGLTVDGLRQKVDDALGKYRRGPHTIITPVAYHSKKYYVLGKVVQRGVYTLDRPTTVLEALARAKGIENGQVDYDIVDVADLQRAFLMRANKRIPIDFEKLFASGDLSQNVQIEPGDYLYFPSADIKQVYVLGEVALPGAVTYRPDMSMLAAISSRGGFDDKAYKSHVLVVRGSLNHPQTFVCGLGTTAETMHDFKLEPNDIIYVSWRPFVRGEELLDLAATAFVQAAVNGWVGSDIIKP
jgi:protein involved in polysaccharide export with SLBB domain